jgi:hypothetical protein
MKLIVNWPAQVKKKYFSFQKKKKNYFSLFAHKNKSSSINPSPVNFFSKYEERKHFKENSKEKLSLQKEFKGGCD